MGRIRDLNRFKKTYPLVRRRPRLAEVEPTGDILETGEIDPSELNFLLEIGVVDFSASSVETYDFLTASFTEPPIVIATSVDSLSNDEANVNVFITDITAPGGAHGSGSFTVETSDTFTGKVHFHAAEF